MPKTPAIPVPPDLPLYTVVVTWEQGHYVVCAPALEQCGSIGHTLPEALQQAEEALALYLRTQREHGWPVPPDVSEVSLDMSRITEAFVTRLPIREALYGA